MKLLLIKKISLLLVIALISSCASLADLSVKMNSKNSCCKSFTDIKYEALGKEKIQAFELNENSLTYDFSQGKSYFKAYSLPRDLNLNLTLLVRSFVTGTPNLESMRQSQVFCPTATFLNSQYQIIEALDKLPSLATPDLRKLSFSPNFVTQFKPPEKAAYVVFHTNPAVFGHPISRYTSGGGYMVGKTFVFEQGGEAIRHPCAPIAEAEVSLK